MHLKSCVKLVRSELRLDLGQQQGALLRRGQSNRLLSTNTLRCSPRGGAVHGGGVRSKGTENAAFMEEESAMDVWSVIRPGHVREKIALFGHDNDRCVKGVWDVTAKRRRRSSQIQPLSQPNTVTVTLQPVARVLPCDSHSASLPSSPSNPTLAGEDDPKLSVVEMVAFLEQRVTCSPHTKLRSSASITLSRAPPPPSLTPAFAVPLDQPAVVEEPESLSVSDMVAKLETQCLRRRGQSERRAVGRVLLAEQQPASSSNMLKSPLPPSSSSSEMRKCSVLSVRKLEAKVKGRLCTETKELKSLATPTSPELSDATVQGKAETPPTSQMKESISERDLFCKSEKTPHATQRCDSAEVRETVVNSAAILAFSVCADVTARTISSPKVDSAKRIKAETIEVQKQSLIKQNVSLSPTQFENSSAHEEPLPGLLFLTPPSKPCVQSEQQKPLSLASLSTNSDLLAVVSNLKMARGNCDPLIILSPDLAGHARTRTRQSPSSSPVPSGRSEGKKCSPHYLAVQSGDSELCESGRTCLTATETTLVQSEKRKSCLVTATELSVQSQARIELSPSESQTQRRRLNRIGQSEKRRSCPVPTSDWPKSQEETGKPRPVYASDSPEDFGSLSETRLRVSHPTEERADVRMGGAVLLRSTSDVSVDRRRRRKAARAFSLCFAEGTGRAASDDFLLMRRRVQSLLEPQTQMPLLSLLPHHLLLQILLLLPTRALAALKCSCRYLHLVINTYDPRPLDALWVRDPRYRDDPCKQCKRRHRRGDVSLCRWHHKPFCQALPYGPGYWMCCYGNRRDTPGCNVGLHDNRWVPAFHSISAPAYRQREELQ